MGRKKIAPESQWVQRTSFKGTPYYAWANLQDNEKVVGPSDIGNDVIVAGDDPVITMTITNFHYAGAPQWPLSGVTVAEKSSGRTRYFELDQIKKITGKSSKKSKIPKKNSVKVKSTRKTTKSLKNVKKRV